MKNNLWKSLAFLFFICLAGVSVTKAGIGESTSGVGRSFVLINQSDQTIVEIHILNISTPAFRGENILGDTELPPGSSTRVEPRNSEGWCRFDLEVVMKDGTKITKDDVNLCEVTAISIGSRAITTSLDNTTNAAPPPRNTPSPTPPAQSPSSYGDHGITQSTLGTCSPTVTNTSGSTTLSCQAAPNTSVLLSDIDAALSKLVEGNVVFGAPDRARIGNSEIVEAKLSTTKAPSVLMSELTGLGKKETVPLQVGDKMSATLNGGGAFDVSPSGPQVQLISHQDTTIWTWTITPKQAGPQFLVLAFDAFITVDGKEGNRTINTLKKKIDVQVGWPQTSSEWLDYGKKLFEGLNWFWASILLPVAAYAVHIWRMRRGPSDPNQKVQKS